MRGPFGRRRFRPWRMRRMRPMPPPLPMMPRRRWYRQWRRGGCLPGCALPMVIVALILGISIGGIKA